MKTVLLVPGFQETIETPDYAVTLRAIESKGYKAVFVPIKWKRTTINDWVEQLNTTYANYDPAQTILAGFSFGAMTVFMAATSRQPAELWLCSLSPYFKEDMPVLAWSWLRHIGKHRVRDFFSLQFSSLASTISCRTLIFMGQNEAKKFPPLKRRCEAAHKRILNSQLIRIPNCGHDITSTPYREALQKAI